MWNPLIILITALLAHVVRSDTNCHPLTDDCPPDPAVNGTWYEDFSKQTANWSTEQGIQDVWNETGLYMLLQSQGQDFGLNSNLYIMYGHLTAVIKHPVATGIISKIALVSDDLKSIVYTWQSGVEGSVATSYSNTSDTTLNVVGGTGQFNTYEIDWTPKKIVWTINGQNVREVTPDQVPTNTTYPQTPMFVRLEIIDGSYWGRGGADWSLAPFVLNIQSMQLTDYSTGSSYSYSDKSGTLASIKSNGGSINTTDSTSTSGVNTATGSFAPPASATSPTSQSSSVSSAGLSVAAQAGIGVGVGVAGLVTIAGLILLWRRRRTHAIPEKGYRDAGGLALDGEPGVAVD